MEVDLGIDVAQQRFRHLLTLACVARCVTILVAREIDVATVEMMPFTFYFANRGQQGEGVFEDILWAIEVHAPSDGRPCCCLHTVV